MSRSSLGRSRPSGVLLYNADFDSDIYERVVMNQTIPTPIDRGVLLGKS